MKGKMKEILLEYGLPKETVTAVEMFLKNMKAMIRSTDVDTEFFENVTGDMQEIH